MYLIAIAWIYVALMMAIAEATHTNGTVLGAIITFVLYGLLPVCLVMYLLGSPMRKKTRKAQALAAQADWDARQASSLQPDAGSHAPAAPDADGIAAVRKET